MFSNVTYYDHLSRPSAAREYPDWYQRTPLRKRTRWLIAGGVAALAALAIAIPNLPEPQAEDVVADYFDYIRDGDIDAALRLMEDPPVGEDGLFLDARAVNADLWDVTEIGNTGQMNETERVDVQLKGTDDVTDLVVNLSKDDDGDWRITDQLSTITFATFGLGYGKVNGMTAPTVAGHSYRVLPGAYEFYGSTGEVSTTASTQLIGFGSGSTYETWLEEHDPINVAPASVELSSQVKQKVRQEVESQIDVCASHAVPETMNCPYLLGHVQDEEEDLHAATDLKWTLVDHPAFDVAVDVQNSRIALEEHEPGTIEVSGSGTTYQGDVETFRFKCDVTVDGAQVAFDNDLEPSVHFAHISCSNG